MVSWDSSLRYVFLSERLLLLLGLFFSSFKLFTFTVENSIDFCWIVLKIPKCMHTFMCTKNGKSQGMRFQGCCYFNHYLLCHRWRYLDMTFYSTRHKMLSGTPFKWMSQKPTAMTTFVLLWVLFAHFILKLSVYLFCSVESEALLCTAAVPVDSCELYWFET